MKKFFFLSVAATLICSLSFAKIWRVNNNPGFSANFVTAQQAHDSVAVLAGDTLYFEHSGTTYGNLTMTKRLTIIGAGDYLYANPGLQYSIEPPRLTEVVMRSTATNSYFSITCKILTDSADNVTITRSRILTDINMAAVSNCTISNCFIGGTVSIQAITLSNPCGLRGCVGLSIVNNIVLGAITQGAIGYSSLCIGGQVLFPHSVAVINNSVSARISINGTAYNNIYGTMRVSGGTPVNNNISTSGQSGTERETWPGSAQTFTTIESGNGNQYSQTLANIYATGPALVDTSYRLKPLTSPALGAGTGGVDVGATGGINPYRFGLTPAIPAIYKLNIAPAANGNSIGVSVSTRSNN
ncbi:MAG: hypothetical protein ABIX01_02990 [Chitinophagaceae bacterium]